jgi:alkanesulfonate monooxygenase SsuD/methylene tetrahydromethanopterin reductase-like flavin-dependent oxidoreductase (luciferase family)
MQPHDNADGGLALGLSLPNQHPLDHDPVAGLADQVELVRTARDLGWDSIWCGQHFLVDDLQMLQPVPYVARLAAESGDLRLGIGIVLLALTNPVQLAEELASLDVITGGRLIVGVGLGYRDEEYDAFGIPRDQRLKRLIANLEALQALWSGEPLDVDLPWCRVQGGRLSVTPVQRPRPPIWMAAHTDAAVARAARRADAWFVSPHVADDTVERQLALFAAERVRVGLPPATTRPSSKEVYCAPSREQAVAMAGPYVLGKYRSYARWGQDQIIPEDVSFAEDFAELEAGRWVLGSPEECFEQLVPLVTRFGIDHLVCRMTWPGMPLEVAKASVELFSREVAPALRQAHAAHR